MGTRTFLLYTCKSNWSGVFRLDYKLTSLTINTRSDTNNFRATLRQKAGEFWVPLLLPVWESPGWHFCLLIYPFSFLRYSRRTEDRNTSLGIATRIPVGVRFSSLLQTGSGGPPSLLYTGYRVSFLEVKRSGRGINHEPHLTLRLWAFVVCSRVNCMFTFYLHTTARVDSFLYSSKHVIFSCFVSTAAI
jgi:hypothetical protein